MRLDDGHRRVALASEHDLHRPVGCPPPLAHRDEAAHEGTHHVVAEGVCAHGADKQARLVSSPRQVEQGADRGGARAPPAEGREVVKPEQ